MKKLAAALLTAVAMVAAPVVVAPAAHATACAEYRGPHITAGGCTDARGRAVLLAPVYDGQSPCYTADGQPYYSADGDPC